MFILAKKICLSISDAADVLKSASLLIATYMNENAVCKMLDKYKKAVTIKTIIVKICNLGVKMAIHNPGELIDNADDALAMLKDGNERFVSGKLRHHGNQKKGRKVLGCGQKPFAVILCCADSRVSPEIFFDQKLGDIFVIRNAGNVIDTVVLGSIEYGVEHLGAPIVVVVGHSKCGAVTAACEGGELPENIQSIVNVIKPSVKDGESVDKVVRAHAVAMSEVVKADHVVQCLGTKVVPAYYDIETGVVTWL